MKGELLELIPQKYLCPKCGKWHKYTWDQNLGYYDSSDYAIEMHCPNSFGIIEVYFANDRCYWNEGDQCYWCKISEFSEIGESRVQMIDSKNNFRLGFEFKPEEYAQVYAAEILEEANRKEEALHEREKELTLREKKLEESETALQAKEVALQTKVAKKEEANVMAKVTSFKKQIYEHSPKENVELIKEFLEKYKGTLKWLVPVVSIYGAYRVLNAKDAKLNVSNLNKNCKKELGFEFDILKDKKALKELVAFGGVVSGAYALTRVFDSTDKPEELSVEEIEGKMDSVEEAHQKFAWIQPKAEKLMPVAASVLVVYVLTQKPQWYEKVLKEAGLKEDYDWYIENDIEEFIEGQWDGDDKKDDFYGKRYIIGRMYYIFRSRTGLDGMHHAEVYECNIDYSGHLEINGYSDEYTFAVSKRNNIIYSWQYFECLDQWKIPNNETIVYYSPYNKRFADDLRGFCETNDADGVKHLYSFLANGEMHKEY